MVVSRCSSGYIAGGVILLTSMPRGRTNLELPPASTISFCFVAGNWKRLREWALGFVCMLPARAPAARGRSADRPARPPVHPRILVRPSVRGASRGSVRPSATTLGVRGRTTGRPWPVLRPMTELRGSWNVVYIYNKESLRKALQHHRKGLLCSGPKPESHPRAYPTPRMTPAPTR